MNKVVDLRSDTVTCPCPAMRAAMATAEVGDDAYGEDPSVRALEEYTAQLLGKEAGLFTVSGTMSNQLVARAATPPGCELITEHRYHMHWFESAATATAGIVLHAIHSADGLIGGEEILGAMDAKPRGPLYARPRLVVLENPVSALGGRVVPDERITSAYEAAQGLGLHLHIDGARLWNAALAQARPLQWYGAYADSVSLCFAKGLGAPMGSVIVGSADFIAECRRWRKMLGGALHQGGIMAKAALWALHHHMERLEEDHFHAQVLAELLAEVPGLKVLSRPVETNAVFFDPTPLGLSAQEYCSAMEQRGVRLFPWDNRQVRAMTHLGVSRELLLSAYRAIKEFSLSRAKRPYTSQPNSLSELEVIM